VITLLLAADEGSVPGPGLGIVLTLVIFIGIPVAVFLLLAMLVYGPGLLRRPRYRPGRGEWDYPPTWAGGPSDIESALRVARSEPRGGGAGARW
jgi:hypothetical protein